MKIFTKYIEVAKKRSAKFIPEEEELYLKSESLT